MCYHHVNQPQQEYLLYLYAILSRRQLSRCRLVHAVDGVPHNAWLPVVRTMALQEDQDVWLVHSNAQGICARAEILRKHMEHHVEPHVQ